jgi:hypothetical protein
LLAEVQAFNSYLSSTLHVADAHRMRGYRWADDPSAIAAMQRKVPESVAACYQLIEENTLREPWVMGETYTICDPYLFTMAQWLEQDGVDPARFPKVMAPAPDVGAAASSKGDCRGTGLTPVSQRQPGAIGAGVSNRTHPHAAKRICNRYSPVTNRQQGTEIRGVLGSTVCLWRQRALNR